VPTACHCIRQDPHPVSNNGMTRSTVTGTTCLNGTSGRAGSYDIPFKAPEVVTSSPAGAVDLAIRLRDNGAMMYGAFWCTHCLEQKETFGKEAQDSLPYVECYPGGYQGPASINQVCVDANIQGFPTWVIGDQNLEGDWPLPALQEVLDGADPKTLYKKYPN
jgi:hypothetical protein